MRIYDDFYTALEAEGITPPARFTALMLIRHNPGIRSTDLARTLRIARSGVVKLLTWFEQQGLVRRETHDGDRRAQCLELTAHGQAQLAHIEACVEEHDRRICAGLSADEREQLLELLSRVAPRQA